MVVALDKALSGLANVLPPSIRAPLGRLRRKARHAGGYNPEQWARVEMYRALLNELDRIGVSDKHALEISGGSFWTHLPFASYESANYPAFDICSAPMPRTFDIVIADQVFEHLLWPYRAARNVYAMLKPGGSFICTTPFLVKVHPCPEDCSRWTETGIRYLLAEAGFDLSAIRTGSWGNRDCVKSNFDDWTPFGWGKPLHNEPDFPIVVWAIAQRT